MSKKGFYTLNYIEGTQRQKIIAELAKRLREGLPLMPIHYGFWQPQNPIYPSLYIVPSIEKFETISDAAYERDLTVLIYYFLAAQSMDLIYHASEDALIAIQTSVDTDLYFGNGEENLCGKYGLVQTEILPEVNYKAVVSAVYHFKYVESKFIG
ncbi:MAG: hypothetical protein HQK91_14985 [Nitrospirae bacterium]|nr:hypothetical protein [Nitrospirota bacterium]MBF0542740.1 hypothetical protein [Nitrospirota bacterium]